VARKRSVSPVERKKKSKIDDATRETSAVLTWLQKCTATPVWSEWVMTHGHSEERWIELVQVAVNKLLRDLSADDEQSLRTLVERCDSWTDVARSWRPRNSTVVSPFVAKTAHALLARRHELPWTSFHDNVLAASLMEMKKSGGFAVGQRMKWHDVATAVNRTASTEHTPLSTRSRAIALGLWAERDRGGGDVTVHKPGEVVEIADSN
jgi:hypothetical protein